MNQNIVFNIEENVLEILEENPFFTLTIFASNNFK